MKTIQIFLASSAELVEDRRAFEIFLNRRNKDLVKEKIFLELVIWEDFLDAMAKTRLQDEYNEALKKSDIFVMLFYTKVGKYTKEEFDTAYREFQQNGTPLIYTYFKNAPSDTERQESLGEFKQHLNELGHFYVPYKNIEGLQLHFMEQLEKLHRKGFLNGKNVQDIAIIDVAKNKLASGMDVDKILNVHLDELIALSEKRANELRELKNRSKNLAREERMNIISSSDASVARSKINMSFLELLDVIKEDIGL